ncbi:MAG: non-homologous end-joining DNA ligase [Bacillota bacterium]
MPRGERETVHERIEYTHVGRVMFPGPGYTKGDVLWYYERVAPYLLPYLRGRPITLERMPDGMDGPHFWQKNTPAYYPRWISRVRLPTEQGKEVEYTLVNDVATLLYLVNQGAVTFHTYLSTVDHLDRPDYVVFDLDRGESTFADVVTTARQIHLLLDALRVPSCPKTSGKSGVHVLAHWRSDEGYERARAWAMDIAEHAAAMSDIATTQRLKVKRGGRVYIDVIQNALGHHVVPPYVLRATPEATVSMPLNWRDLKLRLDPKQFNLRSVLERVGEGWRDPMGRILR